MNIFFILIYLFACIGNPVFTEDEKKEWKEDKWGCNGQREKLFSIVNNKLEDIENFNIKEVTENFGEPDIIENGCIYEYYFSTYNCHCNVDYEICNNPYLAIIIGKDSVEVALILKSP